MNKPLLPPDPKIIAAREALSKRPKPSLAQVLAQAKASQKFRLSTSWLGQSKPSV